nr:hypothetical protein [Tanacetum cinerariifolium]
MEAGLFHGLHLNVDKTKVFWPKYLKTILCYAYMPSPIFESVQRSFEVALCSALKRIVTTFGPGFGDRQWRLSTLPFAFGASEEVDIGLDWGVRNLYVQWICYFTHEMKDLTVLSLLLDQDLAIGNGGFPPYRLLLGTKLLRQACIVPSRPTFNDALCMFNMNMETDILSNPTCSRVFVGDHYEDHDVTVGDFGHEGKEIAKPITPPSETASKDDSDPEQAQRDKDMQKNLALIAKYFKKIYKTTNNNLRTSSNSKNKNDSAYHKEKMLLCKQAEQGIPLQAEQYDWLADTYEEVDEQELEAHYSYMAKIQEVPTAESGTDS